MSNKQIDLERQIAQLTLEVSRLRRFMVIGFVVLALILVVAFVDRDSVMTVAAIGLFIWGIAYIGNTFANVMSRTSHRKKTHDVI
jgi:hypothetical protein